jgi:putative SOS response-associated peptidase YedK
MCGRFILKTSLVGLQEEFSFHERPNLRPRYNIAPTQEIAIVRADAGRRQLAMVRWGLIPFWSKDDRAAARCINARAETIATSPSFREAFRRRRALVPADGFYEWRKLEDGTRQPYLIRPRSGRPFAFAGLWDAWNGAGGRIESATIVTTQANEVTAAVPHRMPVALDPADYDRWLDPARPDATQLLVPCPGDRLEIVPVSRRVNSPKFDEEDLTTPLAA